MDSLLIKGTHIRSAGKIPAIFVLSGYHKLDFPCKNCLIEDNITETSGILIEGTPGTNNIVRNNRHIGSGGVIRNRAKARLQNNRGYQVTPKSVSFSVPGASYKKKQNRFPRMKGAANTMAKIIRGLFHSRGSNRRGTSKKQLSHSGAVKQHFVIVSPRVRHLLIRRPSP